MTMSIDNRNMRFTPKEYKLMRILLTHKIATREMLLKALSLQDEDKDALELLNKYIYKVRSKVQASGVYISLVHNYGYMLVFHNN